MTVGVVKALRVPITVEALQRRPSEPATVEYCVKASLVIALAAYTSESDDCIVPLFVIKDDGTCEQERWQACRTRNASLAEAATALGHVKEDEETPHYSGFRACVSFFWDGQNERSKTQLQESRVCDVVAWGISQTLSHLLEQRIFAPLSSLADVSLLSSGSREKIREWNCRASSDVWNALCIHELVQQKMQSMPNCDAICAWDGTMTYYQLDQWAARLAHELGRRGVSMESVVPLCFEKSKWTVVAMLAVLKAGAAFVLLDPGHPVARLQDICADVKANIVLASKSTEALSEGFGASSTLLVPQDIPPHPIQTVSSVLVQPQNAAYVAYTSGSTGRPKGIIVEHQNFCYSTLAHSQVQQLRQGTRVLQFAAYSFDISIQEVLTTLLVGGCICIPSENQRLDQLADIIREFQVDWVELTPSVARLVSPSQVPSVKTLILGGEPITPVDAQIWNQRVHLLVAYGPAECSIVSTVQPLVQQEDLANIGRSYGAQCWITNPEDPGQLQPIGAVGELLISGPTVARGYLNRPSAEGFLKQPPVWAAIFDVPRGTRFYKTGDLVRYNAGDGSLQFVGRMDNQVKINGQRIELGEIEHCAQFIAPSMNTVVDIVLNQEKGKVLAMFMETDQPSETIAYMQSSLAHRLPPFMQPTLYVPVSCFPLTLTGKLDRRALRTIAVQKIQEAATTGGLMFSSADDAVAAMCRLFAQVLKLPETCVGLEDGIFSLGGNSITAIKLVAAGREQGWKFSAADVLTLQSARQLARKAIRYNSRDKIDEISIPLAWSLLGDFDKVAVTEEAANICRIDVHEIEDIYGCTPLQEGLMTVDIQSATFRFLLPWGTDLDQLEAACKQVQLASPIFRTRIVPLVATGNRLVQVVVKRPALRRVSDNWEVEEEEEDRSAASSALFSIVHRNNKRSLLTVTMHHAVFDGWTYSQLLQDISSTYKGTSPTKRMQHNHFIRHLSSLDSAAASTFWAREFENLQASVFPPRPPGWQTVQQRSIDRVDIPLGQRLASSSIANVIKLAWSLVVSSQTGSNDVVFGVTVSGRNAPVAGIEELAGPTIATFPLRMHLKPELSIDEHLQKLQALDARVIPYEQTGLPSISEASSEAALACRFQSLLVIQPGEWESSDELLEGMPENAEQQYQFSTNILMLIPRVNSQSVTVDAVFDESVVTRHEVREMLYLFRAILNHILSSEPAATLGHIPLHRDIDRIQLARWNSRTRTNSPRCIHHWIEQTCQERPHAEAVRAWDGSLTFEKLLQQSQTIAYRLQELQVGRGSVVGVCMERSVLFPVAFLGVLMTGAAVTLLEASFPAPRILSICQGADVRLIICCAATYERCTETVDQVLSIEQLVTPPSDGSLPFRRPNCSPDDVMYIAFTSGSTGQPKGVVIEHRMACSMLQGYQDIFSITIDTRCLWFSSPAFDVLMLEVPLMLAAGGCVCIPSEHSRFNNLAGSMTELNVNWALLTPSVARKLCPSELPSLRTLLLCGEAMAAADVQTWASQVELFNGYGPAECTIFSTCERIESVDADPAIIGHSPVGTCWIVHPANYHQLQPNGTVGELVVGGPQVGREYKGRPKETAASFISNPAWVLQDFPELRDERLYLTGDLAKYNADGKVCFVGRKDNQVKLHGQRIELQDIEFHAQSALADLKISSPCLCSQAFADLIHLTSGPKIVMYYFLESETRPISRFDETASLFLSPEEVDSSSITCAIKKHLAAALPASMVPSIVLPLRYVPISPSGKTDKKLLREATMSLEQGQLEAYTMSMQSSKIKPRTPLENQIRSFFAHALQVDESAVGIHDRFFGQGGGDSLSAIQVLVACHRAGLSITMPDFLMNDTVAMVSQISQLARPRLDARTPPSTLFHHMLAAKSSRNDTFLATLKGDGEEKEQVNKWRLALEAIVHHHHLLPSRPQANYLLAADEVPSSIRLSTHRVSREHQIFLFSRFARESLSLQSGPIFSADLFYLPGGRSYALFAAPRFLLDRCPWPILLQDIDALLKGNSLSSKTDAEPVRPGLNHTNSASVLSRPSHTSRVSFSLDEATTATLLQNTAFSTEMRDILLATLARACRKAFSPLTMSTIWMADETGSQKSQSRDVARSAGLLPFSLADANDDLCLADLTGRVKDGLRRDFCDTIDQNQSFDILLTYRGDQYQPLQHTIFGSPSWHEYHTIEEGREDHLARMEVLVELIEGQLRIYASSAQSEDEMQCWAQTYQQLLSHDALVLAQMPPRLTLSDISFHSMTYDELGVFEERLRETLNLPSVQSIESIYPCSEAHSGLIPGLTGTAENHQFFIIFEIVSPLYSSQPLAVQAMVAAWKHLIRRHEALRTVLFRDPINNDRFYNVVLKEAEAPIDVTVIPSSSFALQALRDLPPQLSWDRSPSHHLAVCTTPDGRLFCKLQAGKAILDAVSLSILFDELTSILCSQSVPTLTPDPPAYREYVAYLHQQQQQQPEQDSVKKYWKNALDGCQPCLFPSFPSATSLCRSFSEHKLTSTRHNTVIATLTKHDQDRLDSFWRTHSVSLTNIFQLAWAFVLCSYTTSLDVCFGTVISGRNIPMPLEAGQTVSQIVGSFFNVLPCRLNLGCKNRSVLQALRANQMQMQLRSDNQHCSVPAMVEAVCGGHEKAKTPFFNTCLTVQQETIDHQQQDVLQIIDSGDPTEVSKHSLS
ncbi:unnamed protein product [Penicillium glandicola]